MLAVIQGCLFSGILFYYSSPTIHKIFFFFLNGLHLQPLRLCKTLHKVFPYKRVTVANQTQPKS